MPVRFTRIEGSRFNEAKALEQLAAANAVWKPCDIQFSFDRYEERPVANAAALNPTAEDIALKRKALEEREPGMATSPTAHPAAWADYEARSSKLSQLAFGSSFDKLGQGRLDIVVVEDRAVSSFAVSRLSDLAMRLDVAYGVSESPKTSDTHFVVYNGNAPHLQVANGNVNVLAHEVGHFLGLDHQGGPRPNLMGQNSNDLLPEQCFVARKTVEKKLGVPMSASARERFSKIMRGVKALNPAQSAEIESIFRSWPSELQKLLASVDGIEFVRGMKGGGEVISRGDKTIIAINADWFDKRLSASEYFSFRDATAFGGPAELEAGQMLNQKPVYVFSVGQGAEGYLEYLLMHELGHVVAQRNGAQARFNELGASANTALLSSLRFFATGDRATLQGEVPAAYSKLMASNFPSLYGSADEHEWFAESFMYAAAKRWRGVQMRVEVAPGEWVNLSEHFDSQLMKPQRDFMNAVLDSLVEPGN